MCYMAFVTLPSPTTHPATCNATHHPAMLGTIGLAYLTCYDNNIMVWGKDKSKIDSFAILKSQVYQSFHF